MPGPKQEEEEIVGGWDSPGNAAAYQRFCEASDYYPSASAALVAAARITEGERVGDLGCGTGVTTRAVVNRLGGSAQVVAVDPAAAMLAVAQSAGWPVGVQFVQGDIAALAERAEPSGFDCIVCSSAAWLAPSREALLSTVAQALRVGGRFAMSIPSEFVGDSAHLLTLSAQRFLSTLSELRSELMLPPPNPLTEPAVRYTLLSWQQALTEAGLGNLEVSIHPYVMRHSEWAAHLSLPVVLGNLLPQASDSARTSFGRRLCQQVDAETESARPWHLLVAWR